MSQPDDSLTTQVISRLKAGSIPGTHRFGPNPVFAAAGFIFHPLTLFAVVVLIFDDTDSSKDVIEIITGTQTISVQEASSHYRLRMPWVRNGEMIAEMIRARSGVRTGRVLGGL